MDHAGETTLRFPLEGVDPGAAMIIGDGSVRPVEEGLRVMGEKPGNGPVAVVIPRQEPADP